MFVHSLRFCGRAQTKNIEEPKNISPSLYVSLSHEWARDFNLINALTVAIYSAPVKLHFILVISYVKAGAHYMGFSFLYSGVFLFWKRKSQCYLYFFNFFIRVIFILEKEKPVYFIVSFLYSGDFFFLKKEKSFKCLFWKNCKETL